MPSPLAVHELGTGPIVVMLAGFGLDHRLWDGQVEHLARTHRVVCVDLLGTGRSSKPSTGYATDEQAELVLATLAELGIDRFALVGHSYGGIVGFSLAAASPGSVEKLILVGSNGVRASRSGEFPFGANADKLLSYLISSERTDRVAGRRRTLAAGFAVEPDSAVLDFLTSVSLDMPSWSAIETYEQMYATDQIHKISSVTMPVSLIVGENDRVHSPAGARWLCERLVSASVNLIPGVGHYPMFESPVRLNEILSSELAVSVNTESPGSRDL